MKGSCIINWACCYYISGLRLLLLGFCHWNFGPENFENDSENFGPRSNTSGTKIFKTKISVTSVKQSLEVTYR